MVWGGGGRKKGFHYSCEKWTDLLTCLDLGLITLWNRIVCKELAYCNRSALKSKLLSWWACSGHTAVRLSLFVCSAATSGLVALVPYWGLWAGLAWRALCCGFLLWQHPSLCTYSSGNAAGVTIRSYFVPQGELKRHNLLWGASRIPFPSCCSGGKNTPGFETFILQTLRKGTMHLLRLISSFSERRIKAEEETKLE